MDAIMDLTARAVSFITFIQDVFLKGSVHPGNNEITQDITQVLRHDFAENLGICIDLIKEKENTMLIENDLGNEGAAKSLSIESKIAELVWIRAENLSEENKQKAKAYIVELCTNLKNWLVDNKLVRIDQQESFTLFAPPYDWRTEISTIVYADVNQREALAKALEYVPIHIVLVLGGGGYDAAQQRVLQYWKINPDNSILSKTETGFLENFKKDVYNRFPDSPVKVEGDSIDNFYTKKITYLLRRYEEIKNGLLASNAPLSFEYVFYDELIEISKNRELREKELLLAAEYLKENQQRDAVKDTAKSNGSPVPPSSPNTTDLMIRAKSMKLFALAFSGGGIRSATFNLGLLQGLSKKGVISKVDYLSTVSGGGYIGSWLATWIKRDGSVAKVSDRLNPEKSPDPLGEEVRPIRWLRMYSNYFAPNKSLMSVDSWTVGVTWLRNMLLNQLIILLLLLTLFLFGNIIFEIWRFYPIWNKHSELVRAIWIVLLFVVAALAGLGMNAYRSKPTLVLSKNRSDSVHQWIVYLTIGGSFLISALFFSDCIDPTNSTNFRLIWDKFKLLLLNPGLAVFLSLLLIAYWGGYNNCIKSFDLIDDKNASVFRKRWLPLKPHFIIITSAVLSALLGIICLAFAWQLLQSISLMPLQDMMILKYLNYEELKQLSSRDFNQAIAFTIGIPVILLVFGITVVSRMALLGKYFPDERREWWGRLGAIVNKFALFWLLIAGAALMGKDLAHASIDTWVGPSATLTTWLAAVGTAVKAAYSSKTNGKDDGSNFTARAFNILGLIGPYLFIAGLLIFLPALIQPLINLAVDLFKTFINSLKSILSPAVYKHANDYNKIVALTLLTIIMAVITWRLSSRVGVNEFSMHHFYRNRLVRAYLGATRRKASREKTANPFTGFDMLDDEKLSRFRNSQGYYGPYPILNTALNASQFSDLSRQDRKAESFIFSPLYCGFDFSKIRPSANTLYKSYDYGYRPTELYAYPNDKGPGIGTAMAISGAAINPNQGYHSSAGTAFLLTVFNVQMGWWTGNPRKDTWQESDPRFGLAYIIDNLIGQTNTRNEFVSLSDGGHFDNMGLYELVRRRCSLIILGDGEQDEKFTCEGLANAIRRCRIDFGAEIAIDIDDIVKRENRLSKKHYAVGTIRYDEDKASTGVLLYIKSSITGDEPVDVTEYATKNKTFPHQTTADQFFDEEQFESYRKLGMHIADTVLSDEEVLSALGLATENKGLINKIGKAVKKLIGKGE